MPVGEGQVETVAHDGNGGGSDSSRDKVLGRLDGGRVVVEGYAGGGAAAVAPPPPQLVLDQPVCVQVASRSAARDELQK